MGEVACLVLPAEEPGISLLQWKGGPLLGAVLAEISEWPVEPLVVILGPEAEQILERVEFGRAAVVIDTDWEDGPASSLRVGLDVLMRWPNEVEAAVIAHGNVPAVPKEVVERLLERRLGSEMPAVVPKYRYATGSPVLVDRRIWPRLMSMQGGQGAEQLLRAHPEWVEEVWIDEAAPRPIEESDSPGA